jgi:uncharacterized protein YndB with AHSA1/START domain
MRITAQRRIDAPAEEVFAFLADLENHWQLAGDRVEVLNLAGPPGGRTGGHVRMTGPFGIGRSARTEVLGADPPRGMHGRASLSRSTRAAISWTLEPAGTQTVVRLEAEVTAGRLDRLLLRAGARRWMTRMFNEVLATLEALLQPAEDRRDLAVAPAAA